MRGLYFSKDEHVRVDIFYSNLKNKHKIIINVIGHYFLIQFVCILYYSYTYVINSWAQLEGSLEERGFMQFIY